MRKEEIHFHSLNILRTLYGTEAEYRPGQYEAIEATMTNRRTLVIQRTGWGKSLVYFVCTKLMREERKGVTIVVSPLLVLMDNQIEAAEKLGLKCDALNSSTKDRRAEIIHSLKSDELDLVFITPETLFSDDVQKSLKDIRIGLFVIDEAHCISDWGHDFRLQYSKLNNVIATLPPSTPVLGTTATANDRVIADLKEQFGNIVYISRGPLSRDSLHIQVLHMPDKAMRYAWILENIDRLPGSGIIYCLTRRDCDYLTAFLKSNGISAESYYSRDGDADQQNRETEKKFQNNEIKVIVATIKLGMGYDKGDIAFIVHFQMPSNIVAYYQQIGRAGRNLRHAYVFLMCGEEDLQINEYFIKTAFPNKSETDAIMEEIQKSDGTGVNQLASRLNMRYSRLQKALVFLENDGFIRKEHSKYFANPTKYVYDSRHYDAISAIRYKEMHQMQELSETKLCYSRFIVNALDDKTACDCRKCSNCLGKEILPSEVSMENKLKASEYLNGLIIPIDPKKMWAITSLTGRTRIKYLNQRGICLSKYGDAGYGELVKQGKYSSHKRFCDELVGKSVSVLRPLIKEHQIYGITCVPSLRSDIVKDFSQRLADSLALPFYELLIKRDSKPQKVMENSSYQCYNALCSFKITENEHIPERLILVDDIVDSGWTLTICGYKLMEAGCKEVYPFALADSSQRED